MNVDNRSRPWLSSLLLASKAAEGDDAILDDEGHYTRLLGNTKIFSTLLRADAIQDDNTHTNRGTFPLFNEVSSQNDGECDTLCKKPPPLPTFDSDEGRNDSDASFEEMLRVGALGGGRIPSSSPRRDGASLFYLFDPVNDGKDIRKNEENRIPHDAWWWGNGLDHEKASTRKEAKTNGRPHWRDLHSAGKPKGVSYAVLPKSHGGTASFFFSSPLSPSSSVSSILSSSTCASWEPLDFASPSRQPPAMKGGGKREGHAAAHQDKREPTDLGKRHTLEDGEGREKKERKRKSPSKRAPDPITQARLLSLNVSTQAKKREKYVKEREAHQREEEEKSVRLRQKPSEKALAVGKRLYEEANFLREMKERNKKLEAERGGEAQRKQGGFRPTLSLGSERIMALPAKMGYRPPDQRSVQDKERANCVEWQRLQVRAEELQQMPFAPQLGKSTRPRSGKHPRRGSPDSRNEEVERTPPDSEGGTVAEVEERQARSEKTFNKLLYDPHFSSLSSSCSLPLGRTSSPHRNFTPSYTRREACKEPCPEGQREKRSHSSHEYLQSRMQKSDQCSRRLCSPPAILRGSGGSTAFSVPSIPPASAGDGKVKSGGVTPTPEVAYSTTPWSSQWPAQSFQRTCEHNAIALPFGVGTRRRHTEEIGGRAAGSGKKEVVLLQSGAPREASPHRPRLEPTSVRSGRVPRNRGRDSHSMTRRTTCGKEDCTTQGEEKCARQPTALAVRFKEPCGSHSFSLSSRSTMRHTTSPPSFSSSMTGKGERECRLHGSRYREVYQIEKEKQKTEICEGVVGGKGQKLWRSKKRGGRPRSLYPPHTEIRLPSTRHREAFTAHLVELFYKYAVHSSAKMAVSRGTSKRKTKRASGGQGEVWPPEETEEELTVSVSQMRRLVREVYPEDAPLVAALSTCVSDVEAALDKSRFIEELIQFLFPLDEVEEGQEKRITEEQEDEGKGLDTSCTISPVREGTAKAAPQSVGSRSPPSLATTVAARPPTSATLSLSRTAGATSSRTMGPSLSPVVIQQEVWEVLQEGSVVSPREEGRCGTPPPPPPVPPYDLTIQGGSRRMPRRAPATLPPSPPCEKGGVGEESREVHHPGRMPIRWGRKKVNHRDEAAVGTPKYHAASSFPEARSLSFQTRGHEMEERGTIQGGGSPHRTATPAWHPTTRPPLERHEKDRVLEEKECWSSSCKDQGRHSFLSLRVTTPCRPVSPSLSRKPSSSFSVSRRGLNTPLAHRGGNGATPSSRHEEVGYAALRLKQHFFRSSSGLPRPCRRSPSCGVVYPSRKESVEAYPRRWRYRSEPSVQWSVRAQHTSGHDIVEDRIDDGVGERRRRGELLHACGSATAHPTPSLPLSTSCRTFIASTGQDPLLEMGRLVKPNETLRDVLCRSGTTSPCPSLSPLSSSSSSSRFHAAMDSRDVTEEKAPVASTAVWAIGHDLPQTSPSVVALPSRDSIARATSLSSVSLSRTVSPLVEEEEMTQEAHPVRSLAQDTSPLPLSSWNDAGDKRDGKDVSQEESIASGAVGIEEEIQSISAASSSTPPSLSVSPARSSPLCPFPVLPSTRTVTPCHDHSPSLPPPLISLSSLNKKQSLSDSVSFPFVRSDATLCGLTNPFSPPPMMAAYEERRPSSTIPVAPFGAVEEGATEFVFKEVHRDHPSETERHTGNSDQGYEWSRPATLSVRCGKFQRTFAGGQKAENTIPPPPLLLSFPSGTITGHYSSRNGSYDGNTISRVSSTSLLTTGDPLKNVWKQKKIRREEVEAHPSRIEDHLGSGAFCKTPQYRFLPSSPSNAPSAERLLGPLQEPVHLMKGPRLLLESCSERQECHEGSARYSSPFVSSLENNDERRDEEERGSTKLGPAQRRNAPDDAGGSTSALQLYSSSSPVEAPKPLSCGIPPLSLMSGMLEGEPRGVLEKERAEERGAVWHRVHGKGNEISSGIVPDNMTANTDGDIPTVQQAVRRSESPDKPDLTRGAKEFLNEVDNIFRINDEELDKAFQSLCQSRQSAYHLMHI